MLLERTGDIGHSFKVRLSSFLPRLFEKLPELMSNEILPLFNWEKQGEEFWSAQVGNDGLLSQDLFSLLKTDFVQFIDQENLDSDLFEFFIKQLVKMAVSNQSCNVDFDIKFSEIRKLLRRAGERSLPIVASELLNELNRVAPSDRSAHWSKVVGPVFNGIWPLDTIKQTARANDSLIDMICKLKSKTVFLDAYSTVSRFVQTNKSQSTLSINTLAELGSRQINFAPKYILDLLSCVIGEKPVKQHRELSMLLTKIKKWNQDLRIQRNFNNCLA